MVKIIEGQLKSRAKKYAIVVSRFNEFITKRLLDGCLDELKKCGVKKNEITVVWVPGSFEIPLTALKLTKKKSVDAVICLGSVIKGETIHFDLIAESAARGIGQVGLLSGKPTILGVITTDTVNQAYKRSQAKGENKGRDAAATAVEMVNVLKRI